MGFLYDTSLAGFIILTLVLGGAAAWSTGRACALTWRPLFVLVWFIFLLSVAVRFLSFALYGGTLLSVQHWLIAFAYLVALALAGWRVTRTNQMTSQYRWLYEKTSPFGWRLRPGADDSIA
ncbi:DUF6867 family protein [Stappia indica]|uniref:DUF6867 domain-containing protein n=1 Tax=Stappia indica TaxID=538381 RepID=A0A857C640_9HYPH|nr:hypothetical protein [Stappia indica]QGZ34022.1 hypothetical protein GH266_05555 [Stappia indica]